MRQSKQAPVEPGPELFADDAGDREGDSGAVLDDMAALKLLESDLGKRDEPDRAMLGMRNGVLIGSVFWAIVLVIFGLAL